MKLLGAAIIQMELINSENTEVRENVLQVVLEKEDL